MSTNKPHSRILLDEAELRTLYLGQHLSAMDVARKHRCSRPTVLLALRVYGIPIRSRSDAHRTAPYLQKFQRVSISRDQLYTRYILNEQTLRSIGYEFGCSYSYVRKQAIAHGIPIRSRLEALRLPECVARRKITSQQPARIEAKREASRQGQLRRYMSKTERDRTGEAMRRYYADHPESSRWKAENTARAWRDPRTRARWTAALKENWVQHPELRVKRSLAAKQMWENAEIRERIIESHRRLWVNKDDPQAVERRKRMMAGMALSPNKPEQTVRRLLDDLFPDEWRFVGDGQIIIGGLNPDFVNGGRRLIIEVFGDYWHQQTIKPYRVNEERADIYAMRGYRTLIVWEKETKREYELSRRLLSFSEAAAHSGGAR